MRYMQGHLLYVQCYLPTGFLNSFWLPIDTSRFDLTKYEAKP